MEYFVTTRHAGTEKSPFTYRGTCRESLLYKMYTMLEGSTNISMSIKGKNNIFCEEICTFLGVKLESTQVETAWGDESTVTISGNDERILVALYWVVTALRANQFSTEAKTFLELIKQSETEAEWYNSLPFNEQYKVRWAEQMPAFYFLFYSSSDVSEGSLKAWEGFLDGSIAIPTSRQLISSGDVLLDYLNLD